MARDGGAETVSPSPRLARKIAIVDGPAAGAAVAACLKLDDVGPPSPARNSSIVDGPTAPVASMARCL